MRYHGVPENGADMQAALKIPINIPEDHKVELILPEELPAGPAEVIVLTRQTVAPSSINA